MRPPLLLPALLLLALLSARAEPLRFNRDIRPILSDKCIFCHGPDPKHRGGDLRLDLREEAIQAGSHLLYAKAEAEADGMRDVLTFDEDSPAYEKLKYGLEGL